MSKVLTCLGCAALVLGGSALTVAPAADNKVGAEGVLKLSEQVRSKEWGELVRDGRKIAEEKNLFDLHTLFTVRRPGVTRSGLGVGESPGAVTPDGIEAKLYRLARRRLTALEMTAEGKALARMGDVTAAIAAVTASQGEEARRVPPARWQQLSKEMYVEARAFRDAVRANDLAKVQQSAAQLAGVCSQCHAAAGGRPAPPPVKPIAPAGKP